MNDLISGFLCRLRFYGICFPLESLSASRPSLVLLVAKTGLTIIDSTASPADSYYLECVMFPQFVRRYHLEGLLPGDGDVYRRATAFVSALCPVFYNSCATWPASTR